MQIKYVVSTMAFWWREDHLSFELECDFLKGLGYGVEIWPTMKGNDDCRYIKRNQPRLKDATKGMLATLHGRDDGPTINEWAEQIECAKMLDTCIVAGLDSLCVSDQLEVADWAFVKDVVDIADKQHVQICIETGSLPILLKVGEKFKSVKFCLDTGFAHIEPDHSFKEYVDALAGRTTYLHLADNYGTHSDHEPPGVRGGMPNENWDYLLEGLQKYDNDIIASFEMTPSMPGTMIRQSAKFLFNKQGWPNKPTPKPDIDHTSYRPI
jgi:sugar phosphate isomerase/epimerase